MVTRHSTVFLISDFISENYEKLLKISHKKHDVTAIVVEDPTEKLFPAVGGRIDLEDAETGEVFSLGTGKRFRERFKDAYDLRSQEREKIFSAAGLDFVAIETGTTFIDPLIQFFKNRIKRIQRQ